MAKFPFVKQQDSMQCGAACLTMVCRHHGSGIPLRDVTSMIAASNEGASLLGIMNTAKRLGFDCRCYKLTTDNLRFPCILHWNQNHFVVAYGRSRNGKEIKIADPAKGLIKYSKEEFERHWISSTVNGEPAGISMHMTLTEDFVTTPSQSVGEKQSFRFLLVYLWGYRRYIIHIVCGLILGCILQLVMPFLTQWIVDIGIKHRDISLIWLILLGELMIIAGRTATDFIRRWLLLHISMRINISLLSDFFVKLLRLPMSFFDTKLTGDLMQRMGDHSRVQSFLTGQLLSLVFILLSFMVFGVILLVYDFWIFLIFIVGSIIYGLWIASFLRRRKIIDYELFEQQALNQNRTWQFITSMQEIKLQGCERRRRWEWEDTQAELFVIQMKSLRLQQTQEAGSVFINEIKNILITVVAATAVINGHITLGAMLAVQYIVGQLNSPVEQLMQFVYSIQDVKISLERINEIHGGKNEETYINKLTKFVSERSIYFKVGSTN